MLLRTDQKALELSGLLHEVHIERLQLEVAHSDIKCTDSSLLYYYVYLST